MPKEKTWRCGRGHAFDVGKYGDINVLLANQKRSQSPGDSKVMVAARRDFLASGVYQPIAEMLSKYVTVLSQGLPAVIADAGCGEGYYLRHIQRLCYPSPNAGTTLVGWDISKYAVQAAAKSTVQLAEKHSLEKHKAVTWLTASNAAIPLADNSVDIVLSVFGFAMEQEFARIAKPLQIGQGGYVMTVDAGEKHLIELRRLIYPELKPYQAKRPLSDALFTLRKQTGLSYEIALNALQLKQLLFMTPHLYRATAKGKAAVEALTALSVTVDVVLTIYQVKSFDER